MKNFRKKKVLSVGVAMLDIISNALAGTMCLFFSLSAIQLEPPEATRILGLLVVEIELVADEQGVVPPPGMILFAPKNANGKRYQPLYNEEILLLNNDYDIGGNSYDYLNPVQVYQHPENPQKIQIHVNDPKAGLWTFGAIYVDRQNYFCEEGEVEIRFKAYFDKDSGENLTSKNRTLKLKHPTEIAWFEIEPAVYSIQD